MKLVRLVKVKTGEKNSGSRRCSSGTSSAEATTGRRGSSGDKGRDSSGSYHQAGGEDSVRIEVFGHAANGNKEAVFVAYLSNSVLLVVRTGSGRADGNSDGNGGCKSLRSWLLDWPVQGKIRGLCVSPDLQCVLCVTEDLEGVYILAIDNLGVGVQRDRDPATSDEKHPAPGDIVNDISRPGSGEPSGFGASPTPAVGAGVGGSGGRPTGAKAGRAARPTPRAVAAAAFPSLLHLASRGQRRRTGAVAHTAAEPIFIASLARRGGGVARSGNVSGLDDIGRKRSGGSGRGSPGGKGRHGFRASGAQLECLWWAARNGDHFAVIGRPDGEVHFLDLERLDTWVVKSPLPSVNRGRVCSLTINVLNAPAPKNSSIIEGLQLPKTDARYRRPPRVENPNLPRHLVVVLETGAVFVVLLERGPPNVGNDVDGSRSCHATSDAGNVISGDNTDTDGFGESDILRGARNVSGSTREASEYARLGADRAEDAEFAPFWLDVGRGGSGNGGGGIGVRVVPPVHDSWGSLRVPGRDGEAERLRVSVVSRAWGNRCTVKILRAVARPENGGGDTGTYARDRGGGRQQALRTETVRQVTLPADHPSPEQHALAAVDGTWVVLASPPAGGAPARVSIAPLGPSERPAPSSVRLFPLPSGEKVICVALFPVAADVNPAEQSEDDAIRGSWGLVWSDAGVYRVDLGGQGKAKPAHAATGSIPVPKQPPSPIPSVLPLQKPLPKKTTRPAEWKPGNSTVSIAIRRPAPAAVRRAREFHSAGQLAEAAQAAMEALDGPPASSWGGAKASQGGDETGGGVTTRMVREDLANSLLEWLVTLHVRRSPGLMPMPLEEQPFSSRPATTGRSGNNSTRASISSGSRARSNSLSQASVPSRGAASVRGSRPGAKEALPTRSSKITSTRRADTANASRSPLTSSAPTGARSRLEQFILSSRDFDPIRAATLLHAHGEADLAVLAGTTRGGIVIQGVLRVLADSLSPPRLGPLSVGSLCAEGAAAEAVQAGGGTLFAAVDPRLQVRLLMSDRRILFGDMGKKAIMEKDWWASTQHESEAAAAAGVVADSLTGSAGDIRCRLTPTLPMLPDEDLSRLAWQLTHWCSEDARTAAEAAVGAGEDTSNSSLSKAMIQPELSPSTIREAIEVVFDVLIELSGREPPPGPEHRRAWLVAGCIGCSSRRRKANFLEGADGGGGSDVSVTSPASWALGDDIFSSGAVDVHDKGNLQGARSQWPLVVAALLGSIEDEGLGDSEGTQGDSDDTSAAVVNQAGGLPAAARRAVLSSLPLLREWQDPVRLLLKAKGAGCWAAVARALALSGRPREAASAKLHGVVYLLQGDDDGAAGEAARILSGEEPPRRYLQPSHVEPPATATDSAAIGDQEANIAAISILQIIDDYVFDQDGCCAETTTAVSADGLPPPSMDVATRTVHAWVMSTAILTRASVLAEVLCVWTYFGLSIASLEEALWRRLAEADDVRVLTALFFPQLSPDVGHTTTNRSQASRTGMAAREEWSGWNAGIDRAPSTGPSPAQVDVAGRLGLSSQLNLSLMQAGSKLAAVACERAREVGGRSPSTVAWFPSVAGPRSSIPPAFVREHRAALPSSLAALLEHRGGVEISSVRARPTASTSGSNANLGVGIGGARGAGVTSSASEKMPGNRWQGGDGSDAGGGGGGSTAADCEEVWFSCGHHYSRHHLLRVVVPACVSSLGHATSSLQRTQQVLVREYERRSAGVACPDCAAKELRRLVSCLRPAAAAAAAAVAAAATGGASDHGAALMSQPQSRPPSSLPAH